MAEKSVPVGIDRMVVTTPTLSISPEELAQAITIRNMQNEVVNHLHRMDNNSILCYGGLAGIALGVMGQNKNAMKYVVDGIRAELVEVVENTFSRAELNKVLEDMVTKGLVTPEWVKSIEPVKNPDGVLHTVKKVEAGLIRDGLGIENTKLPGYAEGNATYAANAVYQFIKNATSSKEAMNELEEQPIRYIYYATESNPDRSKPELTTALQMVYSKLLMEDQDPKSIQMKIIQMMKGAQPVPITYACAGGGIALTQAVNNVHAAIDRGENCSALVITSDTAIYDSKRAAGADSTQGAAATLLWVTKNPELAVVMGESKFRHMSMPDFTKFGEEMPFVHGTFSEKTYVLMVAKVVEALEKEYKNNGRDLVECIDYFVSHVPFPMQAKKFAGSLFVHYLRLKDPKLLDEIGKRVVPSKIPGEPGRVIGKEPLAGYKKLTDMLDDKLYEFNRNSSTGIRNEDEIVDHIDKDSDITSYWQWLSDVRAQDECKAFIKRIRLNEALKLPSIVGNSYSGATFVALASLLQNAALKTGLDKPKTCAVCYYGSGAMAQASVMRIVATQEVVKDRLVVSIDTENKIKHGQYLELYAHLIRGEAIRHRKVDGLDLIEKQRKLMKDGILPEGFYVERRNIDGTGRYAYSDGKTLIDLPIRH